MARLAMICPPAMGHVYPSLALANTLRDRGHEVVFFQVAAVGRNVERIERHGFPCHVYGSSCLQEAIDAAYRTMGGQQGRAALRSMIRIVRHRVAETIDLLPARFLNAHIECAVIDRLMPCAAAVAQGMDLSFASVSNALVLNQDPAVPPCFTTWKPDCLWNQVRNRVAYQGYSWATRSILRIINDYRVSVGLPAVNSLDAHVAGTLQVSQQPGFFTFARRTPVKNLHFCGPFLNPAAREPSEFPWARLTGKPLIYLSLGTLQNRTDSIYRVVARACSSLDVDLVVSTGGVDHRFDPGLPGRPIVTRFAPQLELLKRAAVCVTHAGLNTALESIAAGVPMVAIPIANDQPGVAARIDYHGLGRMLPLKGLDATGVRSAIEHIRNCPTIRKNVASASKQLLGMNGCHRAADLLEPLTGRGAVVPTGELDRNPGCSSG